jgi:hypothetical protein
MKFFKTRNGTILLAALAGVVATGYVMKKSREDMAAGKAAKDTWAGKVGLI